jgi:cell division transport system ATP-binding protein
MNMIKFENVTKKYPTGSIALSDVSFSIDRGEFVFLVGPSGSGKTTLFRLLIRDAVPTSGSVVVGSWDLTNLPKQKIPHLRKRIGVVFQDLKLLRDRTIAENVLFPLEVGNMEPAQAKKRVDEILDQVGIVEHKDKFPVQLSGGELQRAAIARALAFSPDLLLADEPTGNLDNATSWEIIKLLQDINKAGTTILMATHNADIVNSLLKRVLVLEKGVLTRDDHRGNKKEKAETKEKEKK